MAIPKPKPDYKYSYADYLSWPDEERWELIDGLAYDMSPAPGTEHQSVSFELSRQIGNFLAGKKCRAFSAPFDVRLENAEASDDEIYTVVQPDITVICDSDKIDERGCKGAPDICIEILSPSSAYKDSTDKLKLYELHGVREYWLVNPGNGTIMIYIHNDKFYEKPLYFEKNDIVSSSYLQGLAISLPEIFKSVE